METDQRPIVTGEIVAARALPSEALSPAPAGAAGPIVPRMDVRIRPATQEDLPFIDALQKADSASLGFLPRMALKGKIDAQQVLIAESGEAAKRRSDEGGGSTCSSGSGPSVAPSLRRSVASPIGYLIAADRYFRRDEVGYITQINVVPEYRRSLVAAALLQAQFDRSAYGCRLYSCWCAQDLAANAFWEAMGFVPIAFRTGSRTRGRRRTGRHEGTEAPGHEVTEGEAARPSGSGPFVPSCLHASAEATPPRVPSARIHIFWQKRIRPGDETTPWWYPSKTGGGELREDRLVFPIPPGVSWRDVLPVVLPGESPESQAARAAPRKRRRVKKLVPQVVKKPRGPRMPGGLWFADDLIEVTEMVEVWVDAEESADGESTALAATKPTIDPRLVEMARELRDRWAEHAATLVAPPAKHDLRRALPGGEPTTDTITTPEPRALPKAA